MSRLTYRVHLNARHDSVVVDVAVWCLRQGWWVRWSGQEVANTPRFTPDLAVANRNNRCWIEVKVCSHPRVAIEIPELLHQLSLDRPVVIVARLADGAEVGFCLQQAIPSVVFIPDKASDEDAELAEDVARRFGVPHRTIPSRDVREASGTPFVVFDSRSFSINWKQLLVDLMGGDYYV